MAASIEPFLRMRSAALVGHLPSGELAYLSDQTGSLQLYVARADGLHDQLTFGEDRVTGAVRSRIDERIVLARDVGGNERHALACLDATSGRECALTDDPDAIHSLGAFAPDGSTFAFTHTERNGVDFDLALVGLDGSGRRELAQLEGACSVCDWSDRGILLWRMNTPFDHDLFLVDPPTDACSTSRPTRARPPTSRRGCSPTAWSRARATPAASSRASRSSRRARRPSSARRTTRTSTPCASTRRARTSRTSSTAAARASSGSTACGSRACRAASTGRPSSALDGRIALTVAALADTTRRVERARARCG